MAKSIRLVARLGLIFSLLTSTTNAADPLTAQPKQPTDSTARVVYFHGYLMPNDTLCVKRFATLPDRVYNEAAGLTLSVWYPTGPRIELEPIGPRERLQPGDSASFVEDWWLLPFPFPQAGQQIDLKALDALVKSQTSVP